MKKHLLPHLLAAFLLAGFAGGGMAAEHSGEAKSGEYKMMGQHKMSGTIEKIDHKSGMMELKTGVGEMKLHFPPDSIKDLKKGDKITVDMGFMKEGMEKK